MSQTLPSGACRQLKQSRNHRSISEHLRSSYEAGERKILLGFQPVSDALSEQGHLTLGDHTQPFGPRRSQTQAVCHGLREQGSKVPSGE